MLSSLLLFAAVEACGGDSEASFEPTLEWGGCPGDVEVTFLSRHECGTLTVLEDRDEPDGRTVELPVVKVWPVGVEPGPGIHTGLSGNIGDPFALTGGIATGATRLGAIAVNMEIRGAGPHSTPSLRCPETDELATQAAGRLTGDTDFTAAFVASIEACAERLRATGIDPADYDISAIVADLDDLRRALDLDRWWLLGTQGTMSRATFEYLRAIRIESKAPTSIRRGSPTSTTSPAASTAPGPPWPNCSPPAPPTPPATTPSPTWTEPGSKHSTSSGETPLHGTFETATGETIDVVVDAPKLLRAARFALGGDGPTNAGQLPATIAAAADGEATPWLLATIAQDPIFCAGYRPFCIGQDGFSLGGYLTAFCRDQAPFIDDDALNAAVADDPVYEAVFVHSPYRQACEAWDVPAADPAIAQPVDTDAPLLMLPGQFDSFSPPAVAKAHTAPLPMAWTIPVPGQTHNTLGFAECAITARNQWAQEPTVPPDEDACRSASPLAFSTDS